MKNIQFCLLVCCLLIVKLNANPFLLSTSKWFFQKLFNASSTPDHSTPNIEDLSEEGPTFHNSLNNKSSPVTADLTKPNARLDSINDTNFNFPEEENEGDTEQMVRPGILHRKIAKILNKLQLYSAVRSTIHNVRKQQEEKEEEFTNVAEDDSVTTISPPSDEFNNLQRILNSDSINYLPPKMSKRNDASLIIIRDKKTGSKLSLETGNLGIHIMEVFGSIATILLTAAYQVGNFASSLTQGPVTTPPIEGGIDFDFD